ncbi:hypothetical protein [Streptomyces bambusae]|uniref:Transmembrane protein n=1 Tax=Streptomyces bambusae TaxID=1550616 RepID=A0ABS6Z3Z0_9ACTN|nr:hypothetical protein [Streptomyces bambusae]MBW5482444.1 hypothetical protein [Streptomyces bambusae]
MTTTGTRMLAAGGTVAAAAAVNVATGMLTQKWTLAWWLCTAVLVVVGGALQAWLTVSDRAAARRQEVEDVEAGGGLTQRMPGAGEQVVRRTKIKGDLTQEQSG